MDAFVRGLNVRWQTEPQPFEFESLGIAPEAWTLKDLITMSRLLAADVNWLLWLKTLGGEAPESTWTLETSMAREKPAWETLRKLFMEISKSGSNSWVVASRLTENGAPLIASDPHVGLLYPNMWLLVGLRSPSFKVVGLSFPGIPFVLLGRSPWAAWGGTNMRALSTEFYDVSKLSKASFSEREETIRVRGWPDKKIKVRETRFGPVLSDAPVINSKKIFSVKWLGHEASDEFTAFYRMNRARNFEEFHGALASYGVSAQNFLYADVRGDIAHVLALRKPERNETRAPVPLLPAEERYLWKSVSSSTTLPYRWNPGENFLVSANDRPDFAPTDLGPVFSAPDRARRVKQLVQGAKKPLTMADMARWQQDVYSAHAHTLAQHFAKIFADAGAFSPESQSLLKTLKSWDGNFNADSKGALVYASLEAELLMILAEQQLKAGPRAVLVLSSGHAREILENAISSWSTKALLTPAQLDAVWRRTLKGDLKEFQSWGDKHAEEISHPFAALPFVGKKYRFHIAPAGGSFDTLAKRSHGIRPGETPTNYGATARHVSDLSDSDLNEFVLFGGQDGWLGSPAGLSQLPLWQAGKRIRMPLTPAIVVKEFPYKY